MPEPDRIANRDLIISSVREELMGPSPQGKEIDCSGPIIFNEASDSYGPWRQKDSGEEILLRDPPTKRYGVGVLFPMGTVSDIDETAMLASETPTGAEASEEAPADAGESPVEEQLNEAVETLKEIAKKTDLLQVDVSDDFDLSSANTYKPSSMAVSFVAEFPEGSELVVEASGGRYVGKDVHVAEWTRRWWLRRPVKIKARFDSKAIRSAVNARVQPVEAPEVINTEGLDLRVEVFSRPSGNGRLLTVCLINRTPMARSANSLSLFQSQFTIKIVKAGDSHLGEPLILPYPVKARDRANNVRDVEEEAIALLYRKQEIFAVGHGCAANWDPIEGISRATWISAEPLPQVETPSITSEVRRNDNSPVEVPMAMLAGLAPGDDGFSALAEVIELYEQWIDEKDGEISSLDPSYQLTARQHLDECRACSKRMRSGLAYLQSDKIALKAFQLANYAILLQQVRGRREPRRAQFNPRAKRIVYSEAYQRPSDMTRPEGRGNWRAFQIAFLLMSVESAADPNATDRRDVELIWFPTGGGKTEAYLGLAAFSIFIRRLKNPDDAGVQVLMRYTLRLLTAQQFQRASGLLCAMEYLRRQDEKAEASLGRQEISIGIWLGGNTTPNNKKAAQRALGNLQRRTYVTENPFLLTRCPWCRAELGPLDYRGQKPSNAPKVIGYEMSGETVIFRCPDSECEFSSRLPVYVVDQDIYESRPSLVIGTVDKFATLAWRPEARALFGIAASGQREASPPGLIIQDELHLISGPLGSLVGLYETIIEELCIDRRGELPVLPKIVSSTATIRRYREQVKALYARERVNLFPPPGLEAGDSFFARYARDEDGKLMRGRIYLGVHAPGLGSLQTAQVRTFTSLLQAPMQLSKEERDPWWTLLLFFNSLRELGTTLSLFQSDIPDYFGVLQQRSGLSPLSLRRFWNMRELTGRLRSDEVPEAISALEVTCENDLLEPLDVCLASNIIEVGVDIDRLSLMAVVGQPKTTSQYIQVTGRVG